MAAVVWLLLSPVLLTVAWMGLRQTVSPLTNPLLLHVGSLLVPLAYAATLLSFLLVRTRDGDSRFALGLAVLAAVALGFVWPVIMFLLGWLAFVLFVAVLTALMTLAFLLWRDRAITRADAVAQGLAVWTALVISTDVQPFMPLPGAG